MDVWSIKFLFIALAIVLVSWGVLAWKLHWRTIHQQIRSGASDESLFRTISSDFIAYAIPSLALVLSVFSYGSGSATSAAQNAIQIRQADEMRRIGDQIADLRGKLHFRAFIKKDGTLVLESLTGEPFFADNFRLAASYLPTQPGLPELGDLVPYDPIADYVADKRIIEISNADTIACRHVNNDACVENLVRILLDFDVSGEKHRVSAEK